MILDVIQHRYSPRAFSEQQIEDEKLKRIFEAAITTPSSFNSQPWRFLYATKNNKDLYNILFESLIGFNKDWAGKAPVLILSLAKNTHAHNGKKNDKAQYDLGQAVAYLTLQAYSEGLYMHQMGGFSREQIIEKLNLSDDYTPVTIIALGYLGDKNELTEELQKIENKPRIRLDYSKVVFNTKEFEL